MRACVDCVRLFVRLQVVRMTHQAFVNHNARVRLCSARTDVCALRAHQCVNDVALYCLDQNPLGAHEQQASPSLPRSPPSDKRVLDRKNGYDDGLVRATTNWYR